MKTIGVLLLMVGSLVGAGAVWLLVVRSAAPVLLPPGFSTGALDDTNWNDGDVVANGTWTIVGEVSREPIQTSKIRCNREHGECVEARAYISFGTMYVALDSLRIREWTDTAISYVNELAECATDFYTIDRATQSVSGERRMKKSEDAACGTPEEDKQLVLASGRDATMDPGARSGANIAFILAAVATIAVAMGLLISMRRPRSG